MRIRKSHAITAVAAAVVVAAAVCLGIALRKGSDAPTPAMAAPSRPAASASSLPPSPVATHTIRPASTPTATPYVHAGLAKAAEENKEIVGWIKIAGTPIDYPVAQSTDNVFYLTRGPKKETEKKGTIFLDYRCDASALRRNNILYGHHMKDGSMFASLLKYKDKAFFEKNRIIEYSTAKELSRWEIFSAYVTSPSFYYIRTDFATDESYEKFLRQIQEKSLHKTDVGLTKDDDILTLSTCDYDFDDARFVVQARRIR